METSNLRWDRTFWVSLILFLITYLIWYNPVFNGQVEVRAEQIAKRIENTKYGDRFYLLFDTKYGLMENQVSYAKYISSSNDRIAIFNLSLAEYKSLLDNPQAMEKEYPIMKYKALFIVGMVLDVGLFLVVLIGLLYNLQWIDSEQDKWDWVPWAIVAGSMIYGFVLYLIA